MKRSRFSRRNGYTVVELAIACGLMALVIFGAAALMNLASRAAVGADVQITMVRQDEEFAAQLNETIRKTGTAFTVPKNSFAAANLTQGWNYLGVMDNVHIPAYSSMTGKEITSAQALVYIEYVGSAAPAFVPANANLLKNADGYFKQTVIAHAFTDSNGLKHDYSLVFHPADPVDTAAQSIQYEFNSTIKDAAGNLVGTGTGIDIDTMLNTLNAVQIVYKGSATNPAVALAFRSDFLPTYSVGMIRSNQPAATITLVLDLSGSMDTGLGSGTRLSALKEAAIHFVEELSKNDKINICLIPFSSFGACNLNYSGLVVPSTFVYNASNDKAALIKAINSLNCNGGTNVGDGLRKAYFELKKLEDSGATMGTNFVILMTDGEMNAWSINQNSASRILDFYTGPDRIPPYVAYNAGSSSPHYIETGVWFSTNNTLSHSFNTASIFSSTEDALNRGARAYMKKWAEQIVAEFGSTAYLISLCNGMTSGDLAALKSAFKTDESFDVNSLTDFVSTFEQINDKMNDMMWAFEGPRM